MKITFLMVLMAILHAHSHVFAQESPQDSVLAENGWLELKFDGKKPNTYYAKDESIIIGTNDSVSMLYKHLKADLTKTPMLSWEWRVDKSVPVTDLRVKGKDDRSIAIYVNFPFDEEYATFWERLSRPMVVALKGKEAPGRVISYVWGDDETAGSVLESPYLKSAGAQIILRKAENDEGIWFHEKVDVARDYERIFKVPANMPYQIAISADSDDTKVRSMSRIKNIRFE